MCVSEILPLLFSSMPLFSYPTSSLPKFPHVPLGIVDRLLATKNEGVGLIVMQLVSKISNLCDHNPKTSQTDGQTDDMRSQDRALH